MKELSYEKKEELELKFKILEILEVTYDEIYRAFNDEGYDTAFFDLDIDLKVKIDDVTLRKARHSEKVPIPTNLMGD